jgi:glycerol-3-phosphate dehydrogenase (NAD(P)+)
MPLKITVLGDGAFGTVLAIALARRTHLQVTLWSARAENGRILQERRENVRLLPGVKIPESVHLTTDGREAVAGAGLFVAAIPTVYLRATLTQLHRAAGPIPPGVPLVSVAKGLENETFLRPTEIIRQVLGERPVAVLSGPSHAEEIAQGLPCSVVAASPADHLARQVQQLFTSERFRVYTNADMVGVELAGALKNIVAIAAGISDGLGLGDNAKSALLTRSLVELIRFGTVHGAERATFYGLAGIGDLITTCISPHGRNRRVGLLLGQGQRLADVLAGTPQIAEGVYTTRSVHQRAQQMGLDLPITTEVYRVLYEDKPARAALQDLMLRQPKSESEA